MKHWVLVITQWKKTLVDAWLLGIKNLHQQHFSKVTTGKLVTMSTARSFIYIDYTASPQIFLFHGMIYFRSRFFDLKLISAPSRAPLRSILLEEKQLKKFQRRLDYLNLYYWIYFFCWIYITVYPKIEHVKKGHFSISDKRTRSCKTPY